MSLVLAGFSLKFFDNWCFGSATAAALLFFPSLYPKHSGKSFMVLKIKYMLKRITRLRVCTTGLVCDKLFSANDPMRRKQIDNRGDIDKCETCHNQMMVLIPSRYWNASDRMMHITISTEVRVELMSLIVFAVLNRCSFGPKVPKKKRTSREFKMLSTKTSHLTPHPSPASGTDPLPALHAVHWSRNVCLSVQ